MPSFIEHRKRSEQALISVIQEAVVNGVSTRKIEAVLQELGIAGVSAGQVSQLCATLDEKVQQFRERKLGESRYVWVDALYEKVRVDDVLVHVPKRSQAEVSEGMKAVFVQRDEKSAKAKAAELVRQFQTRFAKAMEIFEAGIDDVLSYLHYPQPHRLRISSTNPLERLNLEIRRRTRVVGIFPHEGACIRLIGMLLVEKHEDWLTDEKAYLTFDDSPAEESKFVTMAAGL